MTMTLTEPFARRLGVNMRRGHGASRKHQLRWKFGILSVMVAEAVLVVVTRVVGG